MVAARLRSHSIAAINRLVLPTFLKPLLCRNGLSRTPGKVGQIDTGAILFLQRMRITYGASLIGRSGANADSYTAEHQRATSDRLCRPQSCAGT